MGEVSDSPQRAAMQSAVALSFERLGCREDPNRWDYRPEGTAFGRRQGQLDFDMEEAVQARAEAKLRRFFGGLIPGAEGERGRKQETEGHGDLLQGCTALCKGAKRMAGDSRRERASADRRAEGSAAGEAPGEMGAARSAGDRGEVGGMG